MADWKRRDEKNRKSYQDAVNAFYALPSTYPSKDAGDEDKVNVGGNLEGIEASMEEGCEDSGKSG